MRRVKVSDVRTDRRKSLRGRVEALAPHIMGIPAEVGEHRGHGFGRLVEHRDTARTKLFCICRIEQQGPAVRGRIVAEYLPDHFDVVTHAGGTPHVGDQIPVTLVSRLEILQDLFVEVAPQGQLVLVERLKKAGLDLAAAIRMSGGEHDIVAAPACQQLGLENVIAVVDVIDDLDTGGLLEVRDRRLADVVVPVVNVDDSFLSGHRRRQSDR